MFQVWETLEKKHGKAPLCRRRKAPDTHICSFFCFFLLTTEAFLAGHTGLILGIYIACQRYLKKSKNHLCYQPPSSQKATRGYADQWHKPFRRNVWDQREGGTRQDASDHCKWKISPGAAAATRAYKGTWNRKLRAREAAPTQDTLTGYQMKLIVQAAQTRVV